ncbi:MAG: 2-oxo acid dehydrogenase subunit E2, partial [Rhizobacter sp.]|nr:2-oxo acid dehydrogenase subunit E2 [Rhizobacter sp.]
MIEFKLPSLGADMDKGTLLKWNVAPGQAVKKGDVVAVVDTSKAAVDVEIWFDGTVHQLVTEVGQTVPVGTPMALLLAPGEAAPQRAVAGRTPPAAPDRPVPRAKKGVAATAVLAGGPAAVTQAKTGRFDQAAKPAAAAAAADDSGASPARPRVSPAAGRRAAELGVSLSGMPGSGPDGAITRADVERAASAPDLRAVALRSGEAPAAGAPALASPSRAEPPTGGKSAEMRKAIAAAMSRSKREIPHYYLAEVVPMRAALDWLVRSNKKRPVAERMLPAVLLLKAVALALRDYPEMNGLFIDNHFRPSAAAHIGVAISLRQGGLVAPALHDVGSKDLPTLMRELADLVKRCRAGSLRSSEMSDPTITVTNLGNQGVALVQGVIYPPQVALVGFGRMVDSPWAQN